MTTLSVSKIEVPFNDDSIKIVGVVWTDELGLSVSILSKKSRLACAVHFENASGFRMLHELDLASWWIETPQSSLAEGWLFEVISGGWREHESKRKDFYSQHESHDSEYLLTGYQECLSVFSSSRPVVVSKQSK